jgi:hypothetical protein
VRAALSLGRVQTTGGQRLVPREPIVRIQRHTGVVTVRTKTIAVCVAAVSVFVTGCAGTGKQAVRVIASVPTETTTSTPASVMPSKPALTVSAADHSVATSVLNSCTDDSDLCQMLTGQAHSIVAEDPVTGAVQGVSLDLRFNTPFSFTGRLPDSTGPLGSVVHRYPDLRGLTVIIDTRVPKIVSVFPSHDSGVLPDAPSSATPAAPHD